LSVGAVTRADSGVTPVSAQTVIPAVTAAVTDPAVAVTDPAISVTDPAVSVTDA
jgi:hypothetical protein